MIDHYRYMSMSRGSPEQSNNYSTMKIRPTELVDYTPRFLGVENYDQSTKKETKRFCGGLGFAMFMQLQNFCNYF